MAVAGFKSVQLEHVHEPSLGLGGASPAADQSNALTAGAGGTCDVAGVGTGLDCETPGRAASQTVHFSFALSGFSRLQRAQVHFDPAEGVGGFRPAAVQLNPFMSFAGIALISKVGREETGASEAALRAVSELGPAGKTVSFTVNEYFGRSSMFIARASSCGDDFAFRWPGVVDGVNRDDAGGRVVVCGVNRDGAGGGVEIAEAATTSTLST